MAHIERFEFLICTTKLSQIYEIFDSLQRTDFQTPRYLQIPHLFDIPCEKFSIVIVVKLAETKPFEIKIVEQHGIVVGNDKGRLLFFGTATDEQPETQNQEEVFHEAKY